MFFLIEWIYNILIYIFWLFLFLFLCVNLYRLLSRFCSRIMTSHSGHRGRFHISAPFFPASEVWQIAADKICVGKGQSSTPSPPTMLITKWSTTSSLSMGANGHRPQAGDSKTLKVAAARVRCGFKTSTSNVNFNKQHMWTTWSELSVSVKAPITVVSC